MKPDLRIISLVSIGVAAYMLSDVVHEIIGHGGTCLILGNKISLISSVYFKSSPGSLLTDLGGPISNLLFGLLIFALLKQRKKYSVLVTLLLFNTISYNLFWFSGTILQSSFSKTGDWTFAINELKIGTYGKSFLIIAGIIAYFLSIKLIRTLIKKIDLHYPEFPLSQSFYVSFFAAVLAAVIAGTFFKYDRIHSAFGGLVEMAGSIPIIFILRRVQIKTNKLEPIANLVFSITIFILFITFCMTIGSGIT